MKVLKWNILKLFGKHYYVKKDDNVILNIIVTKKNIYYLSEI